MGGQLTFTVNHMIENSRSASSLMVQPGVTSCFYSWELQQHIAIVLPSTRRVIRSTASPVDAEM